MKCLLWIELKKIIMYIELVYGFVKTDKKNDLWAAGTLSVSREEFILSMRRVCVCVCVIFGRSQRKFIGVGWGFMQR